MEWVLGNWETVLSGLFAVLVLVIGGKRLAYWRWANEVVWFAWAEAERQGVAQELHGYDKLRIYLETWREKYLAKWGVQPSDVEIRTVTAKAAKLSAKDKALSLADPT